jgi:hypothetical protein
MNTTEIKKSDWVFDYPEPEGFIGYCHECIYMNQAENCAQCFNPDQTDKDKTRYIYHHFWCPLFKRGNELDQIQMLSLGYLKKTSRLRMADGSIYILNYYERPNKRRLFISLNKIFNHLKVLKSGK